MSDGNYRNRRLLDAAKGQDCQMCGRNDGSTVAAHSNQLEHGRGHAYKSHDFFAAWLCSTCHHEIDHGKNLRREEKIERFNRAMHRTWRQLFRLGVLAVA